MESKRANNFWYVDNASNTAFVFVHGFFSDSTKCWTNSNGAYWPDLVIKDKRLESPSVYMAGYYTGVDSGNYKVADCANEVFDALTQPGFNGEPSVISKQNIVFVCHSLGGIVVRYMLEQHREMFKEKAIALLLMASPSYGSDYASGLGISALIRFYKNKIAAQLKAANGSLQDLDDRFKLMVHERKIPKLVGAEAIEHHGIGHRKWLPGFSPVVSKESAARYFGASKTLPGTDHSTCVKPDSCEHQSHKFLVRIYLNQLLPICIQQEIEQIDCKKIEVEDGSESFASISEVLFEVYKPSVKKYYVARDIDNEVHQNLEHFCLWISGPSGVGKTSVARYEFFKNTTPPILAYIGAVEEKLGHLGLLNDIYYSVTQKMGLAPKNILNTQQAVSELSDLLAQYAETSNIVLALDEVPLFEGMPEEMAKFVDSIFNIVTSTKQKCGKQSIRLIVTSIFDPAIFVAPKRLKIYEQITFMTLEHWVPRDIKRLIDMVEGVMVETKLSDDQKDLIVASASGSPRFVKTFFKNYIVKRNKKDWSIEQSLLETQNILGISQGNDASQTGINHHAE